MAHPQKSTRPRDTVLGVVAVVNTLLALPSPYGLLVWLAFAVDGPFDAGYVLALSALTGLILFILLGLYLVVGYWRAWRRGAPSPRPRRFWMVSGLYNAAYIAFWVFMAFFNSPPQDGFFLATSLVLYSFPLGWTGFMAVFSFKRFRAPG